MQTFGSLTTIGFLTEGVRLALRQKPPVFEASLSKTFGFLRSSFKSFKKTPFFLISFAFCSKNLRFFEKNVVFFEEVQKAFLQKKRRFFLTTEGF
jgi:hypothetical protein